ncbi:hypothetical protein L218DRAFT_989802 [Marasmius fiardii PR-910]|nr:hypothetical protein L218DRAFT_989802 [Marasmius fiardii PR-910]
MKGIRITPTTLHRFSFSSVKTTDDNSFMSTDGNSSEAGEIRVTIRMTRVLENRPPTLATVPAEKIFHETSKKCIDHQTSFQPTTTQKRNHPNLKNMGSSGNILFQVSVSFHPSGERHSSSTSATIGLEDI